MTQNYQQPWPHPAQVKPNSHVEHWNLDQLIECVSLPVEAENEVLWKCLCISLQPYSHDTSIMEVWDHLMVETRKAINAALDRDDPGEYKCKECDKPHSAHSKDGSCV